jgi:phosphopantothenoylcysteine decarboxylase / phosphopantothenate---cysteine ligase
MHAMSHPSASGRVVLVGICGGIAAYKAVDAVSRLRKAGLDVHVAMSDAATRFVTPMTFAAISGHPVLQHLFPSGTEPAAEDAYPHLYPATRADLFLLMPATADMMARVAHGLGFDTVSTCALSLPAGCRRVFCPAMNVEMWRQPVVQSNVSALEQAGWLRIGPDAGALACGMEGEGRMAEPAEIAERVLALLAPVPSLRGRKILVLSGPTREHLDPVRFIGNPSSGKMGRALAEEAALCGADVDVVTGPVDDANLPRGGGIRVHRIVNAEQMLAKAQSLFEAADVIVYAAAVADYKPVAPHPAKLPKQKGEFPLQLVATPDVAATLGARRRTGQVTIGFALQTGDGREEAGRKLREKGFDGIVLNALDALGGESGTYTFLASPESKRPPETWGTLDKRACARKILAEAASRLK